MIQLSNQSLVSNQWLLNAKLVRQKVSGATWELSTSNPLVYQQIISESFAAKIIKRAVL